MNEKVHHYHHQLKKNIITICQEKHCHYPSQGHIAMDQGQAF